MRLAEITGVALIGMIAWHFVEDRDPPKLKPKIQARCINASNSHSNTYL